VREPEPDTIGRARAGDLRAFESLVRACQADVWRFAYHLTRNRTVADDVTQETFLRAFKSLHSFRGQAKFTSWLLRIARNCAVDSYRRTRLETLVGDDMIDERPAPQGSSSAEDRIRIEQAVRKLQADLREPFVVIEILGFNYEETSAILGVKIGTLKSRMHRARAALIRELSEGEVADEV
jgi:RNA polymerase sigma-70 factor (ECF subfamily)